MKNNFSAVEIFRKSKSPSVKQIIAFGNFPMQTGKKRLGREGNDYFFSEISGNNAVFRGAEFPFSVKILPGVFAPEI